MIVLVYSFFDNSFGLFLVCCQLCFVGLWMCWGGVLFYFILFYFKLNESMLCLILNFFRWVCVSIWICWASYSVCILFYLCFLFCFRSFNLITILIQLKKNLVIKNFFFFGWWFSAIMVFVEHHYRVSKTPLLYRHYRPIVEFLNATIDQIYIF